jgi:hypothetical protein
MKRRVTLRVESLDHRIVPGSNSIRYGQETNLTGGVVVFGSNEARLGEEPSLMGGSKPTGAIGSSLPGDTDTGIVLLGSNTDKLSEETNLLGGSKPGGTIGSSLPGDTDTGVVLFGASKPSVGGGGVLATDGVELFNRANGTGVEV